MLRNILNGYFNIKQELEAQNRAEEALMMSMSDGGRTPYDVDDYYYGNKDLLIDLNMPIKEPANIEEAWAMTHDEYIVYLFRKYGHPKCSYFNGGQYKTKNMAVERLNEGLFLHHLAEECRITFSDLVNKDFAKTKHESLYSAKNFIYCNYIEHLLLHIKIALDDFNEPQSNGIDIAGAKKIWRELNKYYNSKKVSLLNKAAAELADDMYCEYIYIMKQVAKLIIDGTPVSQYCTLEDLTQNDLGIVCQKIKEDLSL